MSTVEYTLWVTIMHIVPAGMLYVFTQCGLIGRRFASIHRCASVHTGRPTLQATFKDTN